MIYIFHIIFWPDRTFSYCHLCSSSLEGAFASLNFQLDFVPLPSFHPSSSLTSLPCHYLKVISIFRKKTNSRSKSDSDVGDKFEMLVTDIIHWKIHQLLVTNILKKHQHKDFVGKGQNGRSLVKVSGPKRSNITVSKTRCLQMYHEAEFQFRWLKWMVFEIRYSQNR